MEHVGSESGSAEYQMLMRSIVEKRIGLEPQRRSSRCSRAHRPRSAPDMCDQGLFTSLQHMLYMPRQIWDSRRPKIQEPPTPPSPNVQPFKEQMEGLPPFDKMSAEERSRLSIGIAITINPVAVQSALF